MINAVITISGKIGSGKTTAANIMKNILPGPVKIYPMATKLKKVVAALENIDINKLDDPEFKKKNSNYLLYNFGLYRQLTYRQLLLHFGKKLRFDDDFIFIRDVINEIGCFANGYFIVPDVREKQELEEIKTYCKTCGINCINIKIKDVSTEKDNDDTVSFDKTECDLDDWVFPEYIANDKSSIENLVKGIKSALAPVVKEFKPIAVEQMLF